MMKDFPKDKGTTREGKQFASSSGDVETNKKNTFYALQSREDQK